MAISRYSCPRPALQGQGAAFPACSPVGLGTSRCLPRVEVPWGTPGRWNRPLLHLNAGAAPAMGWPTPGTSSHTGSSFSPGLGSGGSSCRPQHPDPQLRSSPRRSQPRPHTPAPFPPSRSSVASPLPSLFSSAAQEFSHRPLAAGMSSPTPSPAAPSTAEGSGAPSQARSPRPHPSGSPGPPKPPFPPGMPFPSAGRSRTLYSPPACCCSSESGDRL